MENQSPATLFGTHTRSLKSSIVDQEYELSVWLPPGYEDAPDKSYPVVYVLDGDVAFGMAAHTTWMLVVGQDVPPVIVVSVSWHIQSFDDWNVRRDRDFLPVPIEYLPGSVEGGADRFLAFVETELIPFVNVNYRVDAATQMLFGDSASGLFALYAMLHRPSLFRGIIAGSPAVWIVTDIMTKLEQALADSGKELPTALYMSFGSLEGDWVQPAKALYDQIASRNYEGLHHKYELLDGETHTSVIARTYVTGLRAVIQMLTLPTPDA